MGHNIKIIADARVILIPLWWFVLPYAYSLTEPCSSKVAEYGILIIGLQLAIEMEPSMMKYMVTPNCSSTISVGVYKICHEDLVPYHPVAILLANELESFYIDHVPRLDNMNMDALVIVVIILSYRLKLVGALFSSATTYTIWQLPSRSTRIMRTISRS